MNKIEIYTSETCPYCIKAKKLLQMLKLDYQEQNVDDDFERMCDALAARFNRQINTVPQIIINDNYVGGYSDLEAAYKSGDLQKYLV